jgi:hypothetical protein
VSFVNDLLELVLDELHDRAAINQEDPVMGEAWKDAATALDHALGLLFNSVRERA